MTMAADYGAIVDCLRHAFKSGRQQPLDARREQLLNLRRMINDNKDKLCAAIYADIKRSKMEAMIYELIPTMNEIDYLVVQMYKWAKPTKVDRTFMFAIDNPELHYDPLGVVLVIGAWNYPVYLSLMPVVGALAAGNCVLIKPSEVATHTSSALAELIPMYISEDVCRVVEGGVPETTALLQQRFDHILYTGNPTVGKIIMAAASKHLTPVTLELGGKCPTIIDNTCDLDVVGKRLAYGKFMSCGQICLAPDYVLCTPDVKPALIKSVRKWTREFYTDTPLSSPDYSRIINQRHFDRLQTLLDKHRNQIVFGGDSNRNECFIEPTVIEANVNDLIMHDEIFGPLLPIITVESIDEAIDVVNSLEKPLAVYIFSNDNDTVDKVLRCTSSGGVTVNDILLHIAVDSLPFGGVGNSGMGNYHGKYSFETFSHKKAVLKRRLRGDAIFWMRYPPINDTKSKWAETLVVRRSLPGWDLLKSCALLLFGLIIGYIIHASNIFG